MVNLELSPEDLRILTDAVTEAVTECTWRAWVARCMEEKELELKLARELERIGKILEAERRRVA